jgi:hypothetical protein
VCVPAGSLAILEGIQIGEAMTSSFLLALVLTLPSPDGLPPGAESLLASALDTLRITPGQMNFDRNWAPSNVLMDSTVLRALQDVFYLPQVLSERVALARGELSMPEGEEGGLSEIRSFLASIEEDYSGSIQSLDPGYVDSMLALMTNMWADTDNPGPWGDWGAIVTGRGGQQPDSLDLDPDTLALILQRWPVVEPVPADTILAMALALSTERFPEAVQVDLPGVQGSVASFDLSSPIPYVVGGEGPNTYGEGCPFDLIVDLGGNDTYTGGTGGAVGPLDRFCTLIIDVAGNDSYVSDLPAVAGAGVMSFGGLVDLAGDDVYRSGPISQGAGLCGQGLLIDLEGNDWMEADFFAQGAGCLGRGELYDFGGDDSRRVSTFGQGFGGPAGDGVLADGAGHDCYLAGFRYSHAPLLPDDNRAMSQGFAMGLRPVVAGGTGLLADFGNGNDTYRAEVFGQGGAYWYGLGMLFDEDGQDCYNAAEYAQGSGIHLACGILWDGGGDDLYFSKFGPSQGAAHDLSTGFLYDAGGRDSYISQGAQGFAINNSAAVFIDSSGVDTYSCGTEGQGRGSWSRGSASAGVFIDMAEDDWYLGSGADSTSWTDEAYGAGIDAPVVIPPEEIPPEEIGNPEELDLDSLFSIASEWDVGENRERVHAHWAELARRGPAAIDYIVREHLDTSDGLALRAIEEAVKANIDYSLPLFISLLDSLQGRRLRNTIYLLGVTGGEEARIPLEQMLATTDTLATRLSAAQALGLIADPASLGVILPLAGDPVERTRRMAAVVMGQIGDSLAVPTLEVLATDSFLDVRSAAEFSLRTIRGQ